MKVIPSPYSFARHRKLVFTVHNALRRTSKPASKTDADNQAVYGVSMGCSVLNKLTLSKSKKE